MTADTTGLQTTGRGRLGDPLFRWLLVGAGAAVLVLLGLMIGSTSLDALPVFRSEGLGFLTGTEWNPGRSRTEVTGTYGALPFIYGTLVTAAVALVIALPLAVGVALYLSQLAPQWVRAPLSYTVDMLAAVPSVVYGLWGLLFFVPLVLRPYVMEPLHRALGFIPFFEGPVITFSYLAAGAVLAIMILPIITAIAREVFATVPEPERQAAFALGATRWEVMRGVVLPRCRPGIIGATMLGLGRALGETIAVALLVGSTVQIAPSLFAPGYTMASIIANTFQEAAPEGIDALLAVGVALFAITILVNVAARLIVWRMGDLAGDAGL
ncbi:MAG: phosphate ABC transporter permease subunit PstC [Egibacteraceae bacterium]